MRMADAADLQRIDERQRLQVVDDPGDVPVHLADERPLRVLAIEIEAVGVGLRARRDALAEADDIRSDADVAAADKLQGERQVGASLDAAGLILALGHGLVQADHDRHARLWACSWAAAGTRGSSRPVSLRMRMCRRI